MPSDENEWSEMADDVLSECLSHFAETASFKPAGGEWAEIESGGIFRETHKEIDPATGASVTTHQPTLDVRRSEVPDKDDLDDDDRVFADDRVWEVVDLQKDGEGGARILLNQVAEDGP